LEKQLKLLRPKKQYSASVAFLQPTKNRSTKRDYSPAKYYIMANVKIILIVDTEGIFNAPPHMSHKQKIDTYCSFVDNTQYMETIPPGNYITLIQSGQIVQWSGVAKDPSTCDCVSIDSIAIEHRHGSSDLFGTPVLIGSGGTIDATILAHEDKGREETYTLRFTMIRNQDGLTESLKIDPKLGVNT